MKKLGILQLQQKKCATVHSKNTQWFGTAILLVFILHIQNPLPLHITFPFTLNSFTDNVHFKEMSSDAI